MSIRVRPVNKSDINRMLGNPKNGIVDSRCGKEIANAKDVPGSVSDINIFGRKARNNIEDANYEYEDTYTRVGRVALNAKVINPFLSGNSTPIWCKVLGYKHESLQKIIDGMIVYDTVIGEELEESKVASLKYNKERYMFGADYLLYLLEQADLESTLYYQVVAECIKPILSTGFKSSIDCDFVYGELYYDNSSNAYDKDGWIRGNLMIDLNKGDYLSAGLTSEDIAELYYQLSNKVDDLLQNSVRQYDTIDILLRLINGQGKDFLRSQVMDFMFILPYGFRPNIENRVDPLTVQYNRLVECNSTLKDVLEQSSAPLISVLKKYRDLVQIIRHIMVGDKILSGIDRSNKFKPLSDTLTGKQGLIRDKMQGARADNTARAVITYAPDMPIDTIGLPMKILASIAEPQIVRDMRKDKTLNLRERNLSSISTTKNKKTYNVNYMEYVKKWALEKDRYCIIGRQPTLFLLGISAFKVKPIEGSTIILSPLCVMPFNADFDGDQMHASMPVTEMAIKETEELVSFANNLRYPKNGKLTIEPRHEILHGLYLCLAESENSGGAQLTASDVTNNYKQYGYGEARSVYEAICDQIINVYDSVATSKGTYKAGSIALEYCLYGNLVGNRLSLKDVKPKTIMSILEKEYYSTSKDRFLEAVNRMTRLGFAVAMIWAPNMSTIIPTDIRVWVASAIDDFNKRVMEREELVNVGIEITERFTEYFNNEWDLLKNNIINYLLENLPADNGFRAMIKSGCKGDKNNILQIFGLKGRVQKNEITAFNSIISGCYSDQLTGLEGFVSAYGSRKGIADKVLATAEPGYMSRKLAHAAPELAITVDDCGTTEGMHLSLEDIVPFIDESEISVYGTRPHGPTDTEFYSRDDTATQFIASVDYVSNLIIGRYVIANKQSIYIRDKSDAKKYINNCWGYYDGRTFNKGTININEEGFGEIIVRSPVYCSNPCCAKCYGKDLSTDTIAPKKGKPIGFIAAQSIGEPGTQMTMKNFQKGGVVTEANLTSSFKLIEDYLELRNFSGKLKNSNGMILYDKLSEVEGFVKTQHTGDGAKRIIVTATSSPRDVKNLLNNRSPIYVNENLKLKDYVMVGDSFQKIQGNLDMREVARLRGYDKSVTYLVLMLHSIFATQDINLKHFEVIATGMTCSYIAHTGNDDKMAVGSFASNYDLARADYDTVVYKKLIGIEALPKYKNDFFESSFMEDMNTYLPRALLFNPTDEMTNPIIRAAFGLGIGIGSDM